MPRQPPGHQELPAGEPQMSSAAPIAWSDLPDPARRRAKRRPPLFAHLRRLAHLSALRAPDAGRRAERPRRGRPARFLSRRRWPGVACCRHRGEGRCRSRLRKGPATLVSRLPVRLRAWGMLPRQAETRTGRQNENAPLARSGGMRSSTRPCRPEEEMLRHCAATARVTRGAAARVQSNAGDITWFVAPAYDR
jgi:hypothetical protein